MKTRLSEASLISLNSYLIIATTIMKEIEKLDARIESLLVKFSDEIRLLLTVPGVGLKSGAVILAEIGNIKRFASAKKLASYAGLVPTVYQSGDEIISVSYTHLTLPTTERV